MSLIENNNISTLSFRNMEKFFHTLLPNVTFGIRILCFRQGCRRRKSLLLISAIFLYLIFTLVAFNSQVQKYKAFTMSYTKNNKGSEYEDSQKCFHPDLPFKNLDILNFILPQELIKCDSSGPDWVEWNGSYVFLTEETKRKYDGEVECKYIEIIPIHDFQIHKEKEIMKESGPLFKFETSDFVQVTCTTKNKNWTSFLAAPRTKILTQIQYNPQVFKSYSERKPLSVIIWGHESLSRNTFMRALPETYAYLTEEMNGIDLQGYNIVGENKNEIFIPMLTGKVEQELREDHRLKLHLVKYADRFPLIWKEYRKHGYLTGFMEDTTDGIFQQGLNGFKDSPTEFYMRPYFISTEPFQNTFSKHCIGALPRHKIMMKYLQDILKFEPQVPKFLFSFHSEIVRTNYSKWIDDMTLKTFFQELKTHTSNAILVVMSDHGQYLSPFRDTLEIKQEERLPMFMFVFPTWFKAVYPTAYKNFLQNSKRLTSPFDIHATLKDILHIHSQSLTDYNFQIPNSISSREMSLFRDIPDNRTCKDAGIDEHWCTCLKWTPFNTHASIAENALAEIDQYILEKSLNLTKNCKELETDILEIAELIPTDELLMFKKSQSINGHELKFGNKTESPLSVLQLKVQTLPGNFTFKVRLTYNLTNDQFSIKESDVERIQNDQVTSLKCFEETPEFAYFKKYCYCDASAPTGW